MAGYFTVNEGFDVGCDTCSPVSELDESAVRLHGEIIKVMVDTSKATFQEIAERHEARSGSRSRRSELNSKRRIWSHVA